MEAPEKSADTGFGMKIGIVAILAVAVIAVIMVKNTNREERSGPPGSSGTRQEIDQHPDREGLPIRTDRPAALPRLVDLGAGTCVPCKMMAPILEDLKKTYAGRMDVQFIDVKKNPSAGQKYGIKLIPTQIFLDASGKELFRHEGFYSKEDILKKWKELSIIFETGAEETKSKQEGKPVVPEGQC